LNPGALRWGSTHPDMAGPFKCGFELLFHFVGFGGW
jgi:hypothetical protein